MAYQFIGGRPLLSAAGIQMVSPQLAVSDSSFLGAPLTAPLRTSFRSLVSTQPLATSFMALGAMDQSHLTGPSSLVMASLPTAATFSGFPGAGIKQEPLDAVTMVHNPFAYQAHFFEPTSMYNNTALALKQEEPEFEYEEYPKAVLDTFNSDLNLSIDPNGLEAQPLTEPMGFCFCWAGARATYGAIMGKVCFEVCITKHLPVDFGEEHQEADPHVVRVGWSVDSHSFQLGEVPDSFGYGGTGKFSVNMKFSNYGRNFVEGDAIMCLLDLESNPATMAFMKNGQHLGIAHKLANWPVGAAEKALFPHVLSKNAKFECNFGTKNPRFSPPPGYLLLDNLPLEWKVRGMEAPSYKGECELIMIVGLPGAGKTTWGLKMQEETPEKRYNIIGTDTLIDKMRVNGLPRKNNYHGRWEVLIQKATNCLNQLLTIGSRQCRNYILDQTNVYATARRRKLKNFDGFKRILAVLQPDDAELKRREYKRTYEDGKFVPEDAVLEMKANFVMPTEGEACVDEIIWVELDRQQMLPLIRQYNNEGKQYLQKKNSQAAEKRPVQFAPPGGSAKRGRYEGNALDYLKREYDNPTSPPGRDVRGRQGSVSSSSGYMSDNSERKLEASHYSLTPQPTIPQDVWAVDRRPPATWQKQPLGEDDWRAAEDVYGSQRSQSSSTARATPPQSLMGQAPSLMAPAHILLAQPQQMMQPHSLMAQTQSLMAQPHSLMAQPHSLMAQPHSLMAQPQSLMAQPQSLMAQPQSLMAQQQSIMGQPHSLIAQPHSLMAQPHSLMAQPQSIMGQAQSLMAQPQSLMAQSQSLIAQAASLMGQPQIMSRQPQSLMGQAPGQRTQFQLQSPFYVESSVSAAQPLMAQMMRPGGQTVSIIGLQNTNQAVDSDDQDSNRSRNNDRPRKKSRWNPVDDEGSQSPVNDFSTSSVIEKFHLNQPPPPPPPPTSGTPPSQQFGGTPRGSDYGQGRNVSSPPSSQPNYQGYGDRQTGPPRMNPRDGRDGRGRPEQGGMFDEPKREPWNGYDQAPAHSGGWDRGRGRGGRPPFGGGAPNRGGFDGRRQGGAFPFPPNRGGPHGCGNRGGFQGREGWGGEFSGPPNVGRGFHRGGFQGRGGPPMGPRPFRGGMRGR